MKQRVEEIKDVFEYAGGLTATAFKGKSILGADSRSYESPDNSTELDAEGLALKFKMECDHCEPILPNLIRLWHCAGMAISPGGILGTGGCDYDLIPRTSY